MLIGDAEWNQAVEEHVGLHRHIELHYYVDCYCAQLVTDELRIVAEASAATPGDALLRLVRDELLAGGST